MKLLTFGTTFQPSTTESLFIETPSVKVVTVTRAHVMLSRRYVMITNKLFVTLIYKKCSERGKNIFFNGSLLEHLWNENGQFPNYIGSYLSEMDRDELSRAAISMKMIFFNFKEKRTSKIQPINIKITRVFVCVRVRGWVCVRVCLSLCVHKCEGSRAD